MTSHPSRLVPWAVALLLAAAAAGCSRGDAAEDTTPQTMSIGTENIVIAAQGVVTNGPALSGTLTPELNATVRAQVSGSVLQTYAEQGQTVSRGQVLARLDASALQEAYLSGKSAVAAARAVADLAARDLERQRTLLTAGAIAPRDVEAAERANSNAQAQLEAARAQLASASRNMENTRITAPFRGIVSDRAVSAGDVVQPGTALFTVVDPSTMRLDASLSSDQLTAVHVGTDVTFTVTGYPGREFHGRVTRVSPVVDPATRQVMVTVSIPNVGNTLVGGLYADGRLASQSERGIVVPQAAVDMRLQRPAVVRLHNGNVERVDVTLGLRDPQSETVQIVSGVQAGDTLLLSAAQAITPGTPVTVKAAPSDVAPAGGTGASGRGVPTTATPTQTPPAQGGGR